MGPRYDEDKPLVTPLFFQNILLIRILIFSQLNWTRYVSLVLEETNVTLDFDTDTVVLMDSSYFHKLALLIGTTNQKTLGKLQKRV